MSRTPSLRIVYAAGPGDVAGTYRSWAAGKHDRTEFAKTYSGDFFDYCKRISARAWVHSTCGRRDRIEDDQISIHQKPIPWEKAGGLRFHLSQLQLALRVVLAAIRVRADVVVAGAMIHWWLLTPLKCFGVKVIPTLHCAFWPAGCRSRKFDVRVRDKLNGWFWSHIADATIAVSPECERQVYAISAAPKGPIFQSRAQYEIPASKVFPLADFNQTPKRILYAGRIEHNKGVFDLVDAAKRLDEIRPGEIEWTFCGSGSDLDSLRDYVVSNGLKGRVHLVGHQNQDGMLAAYQQCHLVVVPTTRDFSEGLNKVAVEATLARRPVITSRYSNALEVLKDAAIEVPPDDSDGYVQAILRLMDSPDLYQRSVKASDEVSRQFLDFAFGWQAALKRAVGASGIATVEASDLSLPDTNAVAQ